MRKLIIVAILAVAATMMMAGIASANFGPHGGYVADTDACAACHRAHTATSGITWTDRDGATGHSALLVGEPNNIMYRFCYVCHSTGAPGAATDVEGGEFDSASPGGNTESDGSIGAPLNGGGFSAYNGNPVSSYHTYDGTQWQAWGENSINPASGDHGPGQWIIMDCCSCHDPHGSSNYRILKDTVNGYKVGGYGAAFASDVDPDPEAWVVSSEMGFPLQGDNDPLGLLTPVPTNGFRLHRQYADDTVNPYVPNYTTARYARGLDYNSSDAADEDETKGMSAWCIACHENYMTTRGIIDRADTYITSTLPDLGLSCSNTSSLPYNPVISDPKPFPTNTLPCGEYDAGDGWGAEVRHRHPINEPMTNFKGERNLQFNPKAWQAFDPSVAYVDIPLDHDADTEGTNPLPAFGDPEDDADAYSARYEEEDWIECLTCHRAHGTDASMSGYADATLDPLPGGGLSPTPDAGIGGVPPTNDSALLRADNRGVCERCHNK